MAEENDSTIEVLFEEQKADAEEKAKLNNDEVDPEIEPENDQENDPENDQENDPEKKSESQDSEGSDQNSAPPWVKDVRRRNKTLSRENAELKRKLREAIPSKMLPKPEMANFQDEESYADALIEWKQSLQSKIDAENKKTEDWQNQVNDYLLAKRDFPESDYSEDELVVESALTEEQQRALVEGFGGDAAKLVVGLANAPQKLAEIAKVKNPAKFAVELSKLHAKMRVKSRRPKTEPETRVKGDNVGGSASKSLDKMLEKSNDLTDYIKARNKKQREGA